MNSLVHNSIKAIVFNLFLFSLASKQSSFGEDNSYLYSTIVGLPIQNSSYSITNYNGEINSLQTFRANKKFNPITLIKSRLHLTLGALSNTDEGSSLHTSYENKVRISTTFSGADSLVLFLESGNANSSPLDLDLQSTKGDLINISSLYFNYPLKKDLNLIIGPRMYGYIGLAGTSTAYNERIAILDGSNYTTSSGLGPGIGLSLTKSKGLNASLKLSSSQDKFTDKSRSIISQIGYSTNHFGGTVTSNLTNDFRAYGIAIYTKPYNLPSFSSSIELKEFSNGSTIQNWLLALQKDFSNSSIGFGFGTYDQAQNVLYESWYSFEVSDNIKLIPVMFLKNYYSDEQFGFAINTQIKY